MALADVLYIVGSRVVGGFNTGTIWAWDGASLTQVGDLTVAGHETELTGAAILPEDGCLYCSGWYYDGASASTGIIWKWDGSSFSIEYHDTAAASRFVDIVEFGGKLYAIHRDTGTDSHAVVLRRDGPGVWTEVLDTLGTNTSVGGLAVIAGAGGTSYLIAWPHGVFSGDRFFFSADGAAWTGSGNVSGDGWKTLSYVFWDDDNSVYRACLTGVTNEWTCATMDGVWADCGTAHGHASDFFAWGDHWKDAALDVRVSPRVTSQIRKYTGALPWVDEYALHAADWADVSEYTRQVWKEWGGILHHCAKVGTTVKLYKLDGTWGLIQTFDVNTLVGDIVPGSIPRDRRRYLTRAHACGPGR